MPHFEIKPQSAWMGKEPEPISEDMHHFWISDTVQQALSRAAKDLCQRIDLEVQDDVLKDSYGTTDRR